MGALIIPPWIQPESEDEEPLDEASVSFQPQFAPGATQRNSYGGLRPRFVRTHTVRQEEMAVLLSTIFDTDGRYNAVHSKLHQLRRGAFTSTELVTNGTFANGTTGWSVSDAAQLEIAVSDRTLRVKRVAAGSDAFVRLAALSGFGGTFPYYVARVFVRAGRGPLRFTLRMGTTQDGNEIAESSTVTTQGLVELAGSVPGATVHLSIKDLFTTKSANDFCDVVYVSLAKCMLVNGGSQTGSALEVDQTVTSTNGILLPNDWVSIGGELKCVTAPLNTNASGQGYLRFKPQLFRSPADNSPIIITDPMGKFLISNYKKRSRFGTDAVTTYDMEHIYE